jgi:hypothetical protein
VSQTCCDDGSESRPKSPTLLFAASSLREKRDHIAVGDRVHMVFDATIRQLGQSGLLPGAGLKRFMDCSEWEESLWGTPHAALAVGLQ